MTTQTISTAETGKEALRPENIVKLYTVLEISTDYLLLGKVSAGDYDILSKGFPVDAFAYRRLEDIIDTHCSSRRAGNIEMICVCVSRSFHAPRKAARDSAIAAMSASSNRPSYSASMLLAGGSALFAAAPDKFLIYSHSSVYEQQVFPRPFARHIYALFCTQFGHVRPSGGLAPLDKKIVGGKFANIHHQHLGNIAKGLEHRHGGICLRKHRVLVISTVYGFWLQEKRTSPQPLKYCSNFWYCVP